MNYGILVIAKLLQIFKVGLEDVVVGIRAQLARVDVLDRPHVFLRLEMIPYRLSDLLIVRRNDLH